MYSKNTLLLLSTLIATTLLYSNAVAEILSGKVVKVVDGDTIYVLDDKNKQHKIRLAGIDAPEKNQPFGKQSKKHLDKLLIPSNYEVHIEHEKRDRYGRIIGTVTTYTAKDLNGLMVRTGYAWAYRKYSTKYIGDENKARTEKLGLWVDANPIPPWKWRKQKRAAN